MTEIDFYTQVSDKLALVGVLCAKAVSRGLRIHVDTPDAETTAKLDKLLWQTPATGFLPHCFSNDALAAVTPIIINHHGTHFSHDQILINLRNPLPEYFSRFKRLLEIVGVDEQDKIHARERFRFYKDRGYLIRTHDLKSGLT